MYTIFVYYFDNRFLFVDRIHQSKRKIFLYKKENNYCRFERTIDYYQYAPTCFVACSMINLWHAYNSSF